MTLQSAKHVNNPAEMVQNPLQWGMISCENWCRPQLEAMSLAISLGFSLGVAKTLNNIRN